MSQVQWQVQENDAGRGHASTDVIFIAEMDLFDTGKSGGQFQWEAVELRPHLAAENVAGLRARLAHAPQSGPEAAQFKLVLLDGLHGCDPAASQGGMSKLNISRSVKEQGHKSERTVRR
jgi:hypothetical protein